MRHLIESDKNVASGVAGLNADGNFLTANIAVTIVNVDLTDSPYSAAWGEDIICDCTAGAILIVLPTVVGNTGKDINITKSDATATKLTYVPNGAEKIDSNVPNEITSQWTSVTLRSTGASVGKR